MKQLVIEEIAKTICNEIKLRSVTRLEVVNDAEAFDRCDNTVCTWLDFEELWKTDNSYVYRLDRLWNRPMLQNLVFFYMFIWKTATTYAWSWQNTCQKNTLTML